MSTEEDRLQQYLAADQKFIDLLVGKGVEISGIKAAFTPGKGRGLIADRQIKVCTNCHTFAESSAEHFRSGRRESRPRSASIIACCS